VVTAPRVSLVATILNERASLDEWLACIDLQEHRANEVIVVDGGSSDGTWEALCAWRRCDPSVIRLRVPGATIARGRNVAIEAATGEIIAVTDAGTRAESDWLRRLVAAFADECVDVASGFFVPELRTRWERALAATTLPDAPEIKPHRFLPSSRSIAFRASWWRLGVRYPEWLDYCEDIVFDLALQRAGARIRFIPDAVVSFRVRPTPRTHALQYFRYARGDGKAGLFARRHVLRYSAYIGAIVVARRSRREFWAVFAMLGAFYLRRPLTRLAVRDRRSGIPIEDTLRTALLIPPIRLLGDVSKMLGYPVGLAWRQSHMGGLGWRTGWRRVTPAGRLWRPGWRSIGSPGATSSRADESPADSR
jgi:glycosyltransferase involved in cell wall biosynthesis